MQRTACVWIPQFELRARLRAAPDLCGQPVLLGDVGSTRAVVLDASAEALAYGVRGQMAMATARALCPEAVIIPPDPELRTQLSQGVLEVLYRFAPLVGHDEQGAFFLSLEGVERLHPDEHRLAEELHRALHELEVSVAIADSPISAWVVARAARRRSTAIDVVPPGRDREHLARLPLEALPMPDQIGQLCRLLGLERVGQLQLLPLGALLRRFGRSGGELEQRAHGRSRELFRVEIPEFIEQSELHLDVPTDDLEVLLFLHKSVLDRLLVQVAARRRVVAALEVKLVQSDHQRSAVVRTFRPARPTLRARQLLDLIALWLRSAPAGDPIETIEMRAVEVAAASARQLRLFEQREDLAADARTEAISRLVACFGRQAVVQPRLADRYRPEARICWQPLEQRPPAADAKRSEPKGSRRRPMKKRAPGKAARARDRADPSAVSLPLPPVLQMLDPPLPLDMSGDRLRSEGERHWQRIVERDGPYAIEGEWWDAGFRREYYLLRTERNERLWVYRDDRGLYLQAYLD